MIELVRTIEPELIQRLVHLEQEAFGEGGMNAWHLVPLIRHGRVYVFKKSLTIIGSIQYMLDWDNPQKVYLIGISISKDFRGLGVGTELLKESLQSLFKQNIEEVELTVAPDNGGAIKIYESKLGFKFTASRTNEYGSGEDRLVMTLSLIDLSNQNAMSKLS